MPTRQRSPRSVRRSSSRSLVAAASFASSEASCPTSAASRSREAWPPPTSTNPPRADLDRGCQPPRRVALARRQFPGLVALPVQGRELLPRHLELAPEGQAELAQHVDRVALLPAHALEIETICRRRASATSATVGSTRHPAKRLEFRRLLAEPLLARDVADRAEGQPGERDVEQQERCHLSGPTDSDRPVAGLGSD
jgi:hypothetical protein